MSNEYALAAVTLALRNVLEGVKNIQDAPEFDDLPVDVKPTAEILITNLPLEKAHEADAAKNQVNLFLYHVSHNAAWRNMDLPNRVKPGETGRPPLALVLHYVLTAYGQNNSELVGHLLLGKAMSLLHDYNIFLRSDLQNALAASGLHEQVENVRVTPQPISIDEVSKLWTGFQTQYRLSVAYEVSVVLIESKRPSRAPLPVLARGPGDTGVRSQPDLIPPFPTLETVELPNKQPAARLGDTVTLKGHHLGGDSVTLLLASLRLADPLEVAPLPTATDSEVRFMLPNAPAAWPAGLYRIAVRVSKSGDTDRTTNGLPLLLAPRIVATAVNPPPAELAAVCDFLLTVTCSPQVRPEQSVALLLGDREILAQPHPTQTNILNFCVKDAPAGDYFVRLRIDGVDSLLVNRAVTPPVFDQSQKVTLP